MQQSEDGEPIDQVLTVARAADLSVTADQLRRWHRHGLLPRPKQKGLGRERGTVIVYPSGTADQLLALAKLLAQHRALSRAGWPLWWQGFPVTENYIRDPLSRLVASLSEIRKFTLGLEATARPSDERKKAQERLRALAARVVTPQERRKLQRLFHVGNARHFLMLWLLFLGGRLEAKDLRSIEIPSLFFGFFPPEHHPTEDESHELLAQLSRAIQAEVLGAALRSATLADLAAARDELRQWAQILAPMTPHILDAFPEAVRKVGPLSLDTVSADTQQLALLGYLAHRSAIRITASMSEAKQWAQEVWQLSQ
jgi:hypothetical protein